MDTYVKYQLEDGSELWVEVAEQDDGRPTKAASSDGNNVVLAAQRRLEEALGPVKQSLTALVAGVSSFASDEVEITFGIKATGEAGWFAIAKASGEVNYSITLKWKKPPAVAEA